MASTKEQLLARKEQLTNELQELDRQIYNIESKIIITDERSGRVITLQKNPYEVSLKYPKVNPDTGERLFEEKKFWIKEYDKYVVAPGHLDFGTRASYAYDYAYDYSNFKDVEFTNIYEIGPDVYKDNCCRYTIYTREKGWSKPGYYWEEIESKWNVVIDYYECKIPTKDELRLK